MGRRHPAQGSKLAAATTEKLRPVNAFILHTYAPVLLLHSIVGRRVQLLKHDPPQRQRVASTHRCTKCRYETGFRAAEADLDEVLHHQSDPNAHHRASCSGGTRCAEDRRYRGIALSHENATKSSQTEVRTDAAA